MLSTKPFAALVHQARLRGFVTIVECKETTITDMVRRHLGDDYECLDDCTFLINPDATQFPVGNRPSLKITLIQVSDTNFHMESVIAQGSTYQIELYNWNGLGLFHVQLNHRIAWNNGLRTGNFHEALMGIAGAYGNSYESEMQFRDSLSEELIALQIALMEESQICNVYKLKWEIPAHRELLHQIYLRGGRICMPILEVVTYCFLAEELKILGIPANNINVTGHAVEISKEPLAPSAPFTAYIGVRRDKDGIVSIYKFETLVRGLNKMNLQHFEEDDYPPELRPCMDAWTEGCAAGDWSAFLRYAFGS